MREVANLFEKRDADQITDRAAVVKQKIGGIGKKIFAVRASSTATGASGFQKNISQGQDAPRILTPGLTILVTLFPVEGAGVLSQGQTGSLRSGRTESPRIPSTSPYN